MPRTDRTAFRNLSPHARAVALGLDAPDHAVVKEFVRAYLGPEYATRACIRTIAQRLTNAQDSVLGVTIDLVRASAGLISATDAVGLIDAVPVLPGLRVWESDAAFDELRSTILERYAPEVRVRILRSLLHSTAQAYVRSIPIGHHTSESFAFLLRVRNEQVLANIALRMSEPIGPVLAVPLVALVPELQPADPRDEEFLAFLLARPEITTALSDSFLNAAMTRLWASGNPSLQRRVLMAASNRDLQDRMCDALTRLAARGSRCRDERVRSEAASAFGQAGIATAHPRRTRTALWTLLSDRSPEVVAAAIAAVGNAGFGALGPQGQTRFLHHVRTWARTRRPSHGPKLMTALESDAIRAALGPGDVFRYVRVARAHPVPTVRQRAADLHDTLLRRSAVRIIRRTANMPRVAPPAPDPAFGTLTAAIDACIAPRLADSEYPPGALVNSWQDLDPWFDEPLDVAPEADALDNAPVHVRGAPAYRIVVLRTPRDCIENRRYMRNCTHNWLDKIESGDHVLVAVRNQLGTTICNADWVREGTVWLFGGCLGRFNAPDVREWIAPELERVTALLNRASRSLAVDEPAVGPALASR